MDLRQVAEHAELILSAKGYFRPVELGVYFPFDIGVTWNDKNCRNR